MLVKLLVKMIRLFRGRATPTRYVEGLDRAGSGDEADYNSEIQLHLHGDSLDKRICLLIHLLRSFCAAERYTSK